MSNALIWKTVSNGNHKQATTHFGVVYDVTKNVNSGRWVARVTSTNKKTDTLAEDVTFNQAIKAANEAHQKGRA